MMTGPTTQIPVVPLKIGVKHFKREVQDQKTTQKMQLRNMPMAAWPYACFMKALWAPSLDIYHPELQPDPSD